MSSVNIAHKSIEGSEGKSAQIFRQGFSWDKRNSREERAGARTSVDSAPITGASKTLADAFQSQVVVLSGSRRVTGEKSGGIANVRATNDKGIGELTKNLTEGVTNFSFKGTMGRVPSGGPGGTSTRR